jgi:hypothetical protein
MLVLIFAIPLSSSLLKLWSFPPPLSPSFSSSFKSLHFIAVCSTSRTETIWDAGTDEGVSYTQPPLWSSGQSSWLQNGEVLCFLWGTNWIYLCYVEESRPPLQSSGRSSWLQIQRFRVRFPALPVFLRSSSSGTGSTQLREYNWRATWKKK